MKSILLRLGLCLVLIIPESAQASSTNGPVSSSPPPKPPSPAVNPYAITPAEWQELRTARAAALKAHPELMINAEQISKKMHAFLAKLDVAILKTDPNVASVVTRIEGGVHPNQAQMVPSHPPSSQKQ